MSTNKHIDTVCIVIVLLTLVLTVLFMNGKALGISVIASEENSSDMFTENDQNAAWNTADATRIVLSDEGSIVSGNGAYVNDGNIYIVYAGKYVVSGELSNGKIMVQADGDDKIFLMLDGVSINCDDDAAIRVEQAGKVFLTLKDGTENTLSSGDTYAEEAVSAGVDGTVYSRDDLTINGGGSLSVTAAYQHGVVCNDDLVITGGTITVDAVQDGFHANDSVRIKDAGLTISAGDDGITVSNDDETAYLYVESGTICITSCYEGLEAIQITIAGGTIDIVSTDDGINANGYGTSSVINITGGEITITNQDGRDADGLDSNKDIFISGGRLLVSVPDDGSSSAIDYGSENGGTCEISGGTVLACGSSGMAEGFDSASSQGFLMYTTSAEAGTVVTLKDAEGNELISETVPCSFSSVLVSTPEMKVGDTCTITVGENEEELSIDNSSASGAFGGMRGGMRDGTSGEMRGGMQDGTSGEMRGGMQDGMQDGASGEMRGGMPGDMSGKMPDGSSQNEMPGGRGANGAPPDLPQGVTGDATAPDVPQGEIQEDTDAGMQRQPDGPFASGAPDAADNETQDENTMQGADENIGTDGMQSPQMQDEKTAASGDQSENAEQNENAMQGEDGQPPEMQGGAGRQREFMQGEMRGDDILQGEELAAASDGNNPISAESIILLVISAAVLAAGCVIAFFYKH